MDSRPPLTATSQCASIPARQATRFALCAQNTFLYNLRLKGRSRYEFESPETSKNCSSGTPLHPLVFEYTCEQCHVSAREWSQSCPQKMKGSTEACHRAIHFRYHEYHDLQKLFLTIWYGIFNFHRMCKFCWGL